MKRHAIKHRCDRCGAKLYEGEYTYSRFSGNHYCATKLDACRRRAERLAK